METIRAYFAARYRNNEKVKSAIAVENTSRSYPFMNGFDLLFLVVSDAAEHIDFISHYIKDNFRIQERTVSPIVLERWIMTGENRNIMNGLLQGEIVLDRDAYLERLRDRLSEFPDEMRERKLLAEFSMFLRSYLHSRQYLQEKQMLDAYSSILEALHHWARIVIIEEGMHPETPVWNQVRKINPGVYKLYEELTMSRETLEQRIQLVLLACEFSAMSKMKNCCAVILRILGSREQPWSMNELTSHPELHGLHVELALILQKMVKKSLIKEAAVPVGEDLFVFELQYTK